MCVWSANELYGVRMGQKKGKKKKANKQPKKKHKAKFEFEGVRKEVVERTA
jgi:hypothetical protein